MRSTWFHAVSPVGNMGGRSSDKVRFMTYEYKFMGSENTAVLITDGQFTTIDRGIAGVLPDQFTHWGSENTAIRVRDGKLVTCSPSYIGVTGDQYAHIGEENNALTVRDGCIVASAAVLAAWYP